MKKCIECDINDVVFKGMCWGCGIINGIIKGAGDMVENKEKTYGKLKATKKEMFEAFEETYRDYCKLHAKETGCDKVSFTDLEDSYKEFKKDILGEL